LPRVCAAVDPFPAPQNKSGWFPQITHTKPAVSALVRRTELAVLEKSAGDASSTSLLGIFLGFFRGGRRKSAPVAAETSMLTAIGRRKSAPEIRSAREIETAPRHGHASEPPRAMQCAWVSPRRAGSSGADAAGATSFDAQALGHAPHLDARAAAPLRPNARPRRAPAAPLLRLDARQAPLDVGTAPSRRAAGALFRFPAPGRVGFCRAGLAAPGGVAGAGGRVLQRRGGCQRLERRGGTGRAPWSHCRAAWSNGPGPHLTPRP